MSKRPPTRSAMIEELLATLDLLRAYVVKVQLKVVGEQCWVRLTIAADPTARPHEKAPKAIRGRPGLPRSG